MSVINLLKIPSQEYKSKEGNLWDIECCADSEAILKPKRNCITAAINEDLQSFYITLNPSMTF